MKGFITNLGKYNEGELMGMWIDFPVTNENYVRALWEIGIDGEEHKEVFFTDYEDVPEGFDLGEYEDVDHLNAIAELLESEVMQAAAEVFGSDAVEGTTEDDWLLLADVHDDYGLGYYWAEESGCYNLEELGPLACYIDYEAFGRDVRLESSGYYSSLGWIERM